MRSSHVLHTVLLFSLSSSSDVEILKPGCGGIPTFNYIRKLQLTLVLMAIACFLFFCGCVLRLCLNVRNQLKGDHETTEEDDDLLDSEESSGDESEISVSSRSLSSRSRKTVKGNAAAEEQEKAEAVLARLRRLISWRHPHRTLKIIQKLPAWIVRDKSCAHEDSCTSIATSCEF
jgi:hypothetical protein